MPTLSIPIGPATAILQNVVWAMPATSVTVQTTAALESSLEVGGTFTAFTSPVCTGAFVRCPTGNATVTLRRNTVVP